MKLETGLFKAQRSIGLGSVSTTPTTYFRVKNFVFHSLLFQEATITQPPDHVWCVTAFSGHDVTPHEAPLAHPFGHVRGEIMYRNLFCRGVFRVDSASKPAADSVAATSPGSSVALAAMNKQPITRARYGQLCAYLRRTHF